jgi:predicted metal-dependent peptidase
MPTPLPHEQAMVHAKVAFMNDLKAMFLYTACFHLQFKWSDKIPTAQVNGYTMTLNPVFWMKISHEMRVTLLAHETGHVIRDHMTRRGNRDKKLYNYAGDYVINQELKEAGYAVIKWTLDDGRDTHWLQDDRFAGMSTERVYDILYAEQPPPPPPTSAGGSGAPSPAGQSTPGDGEGAGSAPADGTDPDAHWVDIAEPSEDANGDPVDAAQVADHIKEIIVASANAAQMNGQPGSIPGAVQMYLDSLLKPKLPMSTYLRRFFTALQKNDYTWQRPNRRYMPMYLPSMRSEALCEIAFAYDMSASVKDTDIKRYVSEMVGVMRNLKPTKLTLILFDTDIRSVTTIKSVQDLINVKLIGRGGTDIYPLMEWADKNKPAALCVFTDGEFYVREQKPPCPVLWMIHNKRRKFECDYGTIIPFEV